MFLYVFLSIQPDLYPILIHIPLFLFFLTNITFHTFIQDIHTPILASSGFLCIFVIKHLPKCPTIPVASGLKRFISAQMKIVIVVLSFFLFFGTDVYCGNYGESRTWGLIEKEDSLSKLLEDFNRIDVRVVTLDNKKEGIPYRIVVLGNSLSHHGRAEQIGWNHDHGMAASAPSRDYVHLLFGSIEEAMPEKRVQMLVYNIADFERNFDTFDLDQLESLKNFGPDLLVLQIGENVGLNEQKTIGLFEKRYSELIGYFKTEPGLSVVCTTPFFFSEPMKNAITKAAEQMGARVADISSLTTDDPENLAKEEPNYPGDRSEWKVDGIGMHPGDKGMENIARILFENIDL